jgi:hypothetical protein
MPQTEKPENHGLTAGPLLVWRDMWYLHDGASPRSARDLNTCLDASLENPWIGRNGPIMASSFTGPKPLTFFMRPLKTNCVGDSS